MDESAGGRGEGEAGMVAETAAWRRLSCAMTSVRETEGDGIAGFEAADGDG